MGFKQKGIFCPVEYIVFFREVNFSFFDFIIFFFSFDFFSCFVRTEGPSVRTELFEVYVRCRSLLCANGPSDCCRTRTASGFSFVLLITSIGTYFLAQIFVWQIRGKNVYRRDCLWPFASYVVFYTTEGH